MDHRKALIEKLEELDRIDSEHLPIVTIDEYFIGNNEEECIAPNQWGYGRPSVHDIYNHLKSIEKRPDVQGVYVGLHQDWGEALEDASLWPAAENIHIFSSASQEVADKWIDGLESDGIGTGWPYGKHAASPDPKPGYDVYTIYWD